jgi:hypothetical protein
MADDAVSLDRSSGMWALVWRANHGAPFAAALQHRDLDCGPAQLLLCCKNKRGPIRV